ncbi:MULTISPECIES: hypothetical protein [unclassified Lentimicrobium]|uniref:hypothetical protein n=1 Tax=unclassified Lentimicrobium TaxID=2677434 RepID=UPI0015583175|nr:MULTISPECIES: hypothetical protein [unclassified Lentimicrobium]NPD45322.1 hypothetical protein [Lentimicrobium sp. S6]NPD84379.1 hypothetical protein [Lentimicrobium sp. L6]
MKFYLYFISLLAISLLLIQCKTTKIETESKMTILIDSEDNGPEMTINFINGIGYNRPTYVLWMEDLEGHYIKTLFITKSYASGIFGYEMQGDSIWIKKSGPSYQPAALPYWSHKKGETNGQLIPSPEQPFVDAYTGATPEQNFEIKTSSMNLDKKYRIFLEVNQSWDWNSFWTNNKYPENKAYQHSAQPSIVYAVEINSASESFFLNPIGHGDAKGESGKLFTNLNTLTSALKIFNSIEVRINSQNN